MNNLVGVPINALVFDIRFIDQLFFERINYIWVVFGLLGQHNVIFDLKDILIDLVGGW